ncbi:unnamed protein product [Moneuplotes crassus]|uniref:IFT81 calponin homology domain-containing protein n=1 Tax=Euplotes crassus TaxID=5936 RepID=A0AAD2D630_EUPCR|nr:unnamed protein product [Moneuplotes crassus]
MESTGSLLKVMGYIHTEASIDQGIILQDPREDFKLGHELKSIDIRYMVETLNKPPFDCDLSIVDLDVKQPFELLKLLNRVLGEFDDTQKEIDIGSETREDTTNRICKFLTMLGVPCETDSSLRFGLSCNNKETILKILSCILQIFENSKEQRDRSAFLSSIPIPEEFLMDEQIRQEINTYKSLQEKLNITGDHLKTLESKDKQQDAMNKQITELELQKQELSSKLKILKDTKNDPDFIVLLEAIKLLSKEQLSQSKIDLMTAEQSQLLQNTIQDKHHSRSQLLSVSQEILGPQTADDLFSTTLIADVQENREGYYNILEPEYEEKSTRCSLLTKSLETPITEDQILLLEQDCATLTAECEALNLKIPTNSPFNDLLKKFQLAQLTKKNQIAELAHLTSTKDQFEATMQAEKGPSLQLRQLGPRRQELYEKCTKKLKEKKLRYDAMKKKLADITSEKDVLTKTKEGLEAKIERDEEKRRKLEESKGISGYRGIEKNLEKVKKELDEIDTFKKNKLEQLQETNYLLQEQIISKKNRLCAPIKKLRVNRMAYKIMAAEYESCKKKHEESQIHFIADDENLEEITDKLCHDHKKEETKYHSLNIQNKINIALEKIIQKESDFQNNPESRFSDNFKTLSEMYSAKINQQKEIICILEQNLKDKNDTQEDEHLQLIQTDEVTIASTENETIQSESAPSHCTDQ